MEDLRSKIGTIGSNGATITDITCKCGHSIDDHKVLISGFQSNIGNGGHGTCIECCCTTFRLGKLRYGRKYAAVK